MKKALVVVVLLILIGGGAFWYFQKNNGPLTPSPAPSQAGPADIDVDDFEVALNRAVNWLKQTQQPDGGWGAPGEATDPGITGLVLKGLAASGVKPADNPWMQKGIDKMLSYQAEDGSIFLKSNQSYITAIAISALAAIDRQKYSTQIERARDYLLRIQFRAGEERTAKPHYEGGITYNDEQKPPNLSTTIFALEGLKESGLPEDHEAFQLALKFIQRCQNRTESNDMPLDVILNNDGGFFYAPGDTRGQVEETDGRKTLRSYGSMTYAGLLGLAYANLTLEDPRAKDAMAWIEKNYTFDKNPGALKPGQGLYYYYMTISKTIKAFGIKKTPGGKEVAKDLQEAILKRQKADGSWVNTEEERWWEGNPTLCTAYMLTTLGNLKDLK